MAELHDLLERATTDLDPDVGSLVRGGRERGIRARSRRRRGATVGAVALAGALGTAAWLVPAYLAPDAGPQSVHVADPAAGGHHLPDPARVSTLLGELLPNGTAAPIDKSGESGPNGYAMAAWSLDPPGAVGPGRVGVIVERPWGATAPISKPPGWLHSPAACEERHVVCRDLPHGRFLVIRDVAVRGGPSVVELYTSDGFNISAVAYNTVNPRVRDLAHPTSAPVLSDSQLVEIVQDPRWLQ